MAEYSRYPYLRYLVLASVPGCVDDARGVVGDADDGDLDQHQVLFQQPLLLLVLLLGQEMHPQLLEAAATRIDQ